jgi:hypothetical protein
MDALACTLPISMYHLINSAIGGIMNVRRNALPTAAIAMLLSGACLVIPEAAIAAQPSTSPAAPSADSTQPDSRATPHADAPSAPSASGQSRGDSRDQSAPVVQPPMTKQQKSREMPLPGQSQDHSATNLEEKK